MAEFKKFSTQGLFTQYQFKLRSFDQDLLKVIEEVLSNLGNLLNRGISFDDNIDCRELTVTTNVAPDTEDTIPHTLGRIPVRFIVTDINKGGVVYRGLTAFTKTNIYLKCTTASTAVKVLIF